MALRTFETKLKSVKDSWTHYRKQHSISLTASPFCTPTYIYRQRLRSSMQASFLGRKPQGVPGRWVGKWCKFFWFTFQGGAHFNRHFSAAESVIRCHSYTNTQPVLSLCRQLAGVSKEETSLLSDCLVICITNEPFYFRDVKQASINEQFLKLKLLTQSSSFHSRVSPEIALYSIEVHQFEIGKHIPIIDPCNQPLL